MSEMMDLIGLGMVSFLLVMEIYFIWSVYYYDKTVHEKTSYIKVSVLAAIWVISFVMSLPFITIFAIMYCLWRQGNKKDLKKLVFFTLALLVWACVAVYLES